MELIIARVSSVLCLLVLTLFFGTLPYWAILRHNVNVASSRRETIVKYLNCFSGGVFLGSLFLNLMTEGSEEFDKYIEAVHYDSDYPFFNVVVTLGFILTSSVEYFAHFWLVREKNSTRQEKSNRNSEGEESPLYSDDKKDYGTVAAESVTMANSECLSVDGHNDSTSVDGCETILFQGGNHIDPGHNHSHSQENQNLTVSTTCHATFNIRGVLLLLALSFHSVFDGLALGLQEKSSSIWEIFAAVLLHKCIVAFCLGLDIFMTFSDTKMATLMMVIFSLVSPIGASIGISMTSSGINTNAKHLSSGILQALSCGVFLYVTFLEILNKYWKGSGCQQTFLDIISTLMGFVIMAILKIWS